MVPAIQAAAPGVRAGASVRSGPPSTPGAPERSRFGIVVWELSSGECLLATDRAVEVLGIPLPQLLGSDVRTYLRPEETEDVIKAWSKGQISNAHGRLSFLVPGRTAKMLAVWSRLMRLGETDVIVDLVAPASEVDKLGCEPSQPWRQLASIVLGTSGHQRRIQSISDDITYLTGRRPTEWIGQPLATFVHGDDTAFLNAANAAPKDQTQAEVRIRDTHDEWLRCAIVFGPDRPSGSTAFALIGLAAESIPEWRDRVRELEMRLRQIGAEVQAAEVFDEISRSPDIGKFPQLMGLTNRQREVLSRLLRGERVQTIARDLYLSPNTVRNHLSTIFRRFGVHSQAELITELLPPNKPS